jgi:16S rRNA (guanine1207-N2)-methyltransferase
MTHYFEDIKRKEEDYFLIEDYVANKKYTFKSCDNVFSKNSVDYGTKVLIKTVLKNFDHLGKKVLDLGCGYGAVGVVLANNYPDSHFIMSDITKTASRLSKHNLHLNNITNAEVINSNLFEQIKDKFNFIITNPPIKVGKQVLLNAINQSVEKLKKDGQLVLVIKKSHGKDSIKKAMQKVFGNCEILKRDKGYYILASKKM